MPRTKKSQFYRAGGKFVAAASEQVTVGYQGMRRMTTSLSVQMKNTCQMAILVGGHASSYDRSSTFPKVTRMFRSLIFAVLI